MRFTHVGYSGVKSESCRHYLTLSERRPSSAIFLNGTAARIFSEMRCT